MENSKEINQIYEYAELEYLLSRKFYLTNDIKLHYMNDSTARKTVELLLKTGHVDIETFKHQVYIYFGTHKDLIDKYMDTSIYDDEFMDLNLDDIYIDYHLDKDNNIVYK